MQPDWISKLSWELVEFCPTIFSLYLLCNECIMRTSVTLSFLRAIRETVMLKRNISLSFSYLDLCKEEHSPSLGWANTSIHLKFLSTLSIHFTAFQCSFHGFSRNMLTTMATWAISGLVHIIGYLTLLNNGGIWNFVHALFFLPCFRTRLLAQRHMTRQRCANKLSILHVKSL